MNPNFRPGTHPALRNPADGRHRGRPGRLSADVRGDLSGPGNSSRGADAQPGRLCTLPRGGRTPERTSNQRQFDRTGCGRCTHDGARPLRFAGRHPHRPLATALEAEVHQQAGAPQQVLPVRLRCCPRAFRTIALPAHSRGARFASRDLSARRDARSSGVFGTPIPALFLVQLRRHGSGRTLRDGAGIRCRGNKGRFALGAAIQSRITQGSRDIGPVRYPMSWCVSRCTRSPRPRGIAAATLGREI